MVNLTTMLAKCRDFTRIFVEQTLALNGTIGSALPLVLGVAAVICHVGQVAARLPGGVACARCRA